MTKPKKRRRKKLKFSKLVVFAMLISLLIFTIAMTIVFIVKGSVPDSLITSVFVFSGGEAGILGWIKFGDTKYKGEDTKEEP